MYSKALGEMLWIFQYQSTAAFFWIPGSHLENLPLVGM